MNKTRQIVRGDFIALRHDNHTFDNIPQFPDIARPGIILEFVQNLGQDCFAEAEMMVVFIKEISDQQRNIFLAIPKGWHVNRHNHEAVVEVFTEGAFFEHFREIPVRGGNDPHIDGRGFRCPQSRNLFVLNGPQNLYLQGEWQFSHLVEEKRPSVSHFE